MTDIEQNQNVGEKLNLPEPIKVKPSIAKYLDKLEEHGKTIWPFLATNVIETLFTLHLLNKYNSKCITKYVRKREYDRPFGIRMPLKINYSKKDEEELNEQFNKLSEILVKCVKSGEKVIIIPLIYERGMSPHANTLIYKVENNEIEHFEPHGGEFNADEKIQSSAKKILTYFVAILNRHLKRNGLREDVKYIEASQVCPYIKGLQTIEAESKIKRKPKLEPPGYCSAWSMFFCELNLKNPTLTSREILNSVYNYLTTKASGPDYLKRVIRGYSGYIYQTIERYLSIFFKPKLTVQEAIEIGKTNNSRFIKLSEVMDVLVSLEAEIAINSDFNYKKVLKQTMREYKLKTNGKTKEEQREMQLNNKELRDLYYKKRILQNYEEYKNVGHISESVADSLEDISINDIKNLDIIKKGHFYEERKRQIEDIRSRPEYIEAMEQRERMKKERAEFKKNTKTLVKKQTTKGKTRKVKQVLPENEISDD